MTAAMTHNNSGAGTNAHGKPNGFGNGGGDIARVQIYRYVTRDRVLDISDMLNLEARRSKIALTLVEYDAQYKAQTRVRHYADAPDFKLVCWDILHSTFNEWTDHKGSPAPSIGDGVSAGLQARVLTLRKDVKYRQPFVFKIDNGVGEALPGGAVKMARATDSLTLLMPEWDARRMAQTVLDYIRDWETIHFRKRQEAQTVILPPPLLAAQSDDDADSESGESRSNRRKVL